MTTSHAMGNKETPANQTPANQKQDQKLAEKRRALGRGLESLLPGPRAVGPTVPVASKPVNPPASSHREHSSYSEPGSTSEHGSSSSPEQPAAATQIPAAAERESANDGSTSVVSTIRASAIGDGEVMEIEIAQIDLNPYQTRKEFDEQLLKDLAASIEVQGVMQPIVVRPTPVRPTPVRPAPVSPTPVPPAVPASAAAPSASDGQPMGERFILILGERRLRASKMLGLKSIPAVVKRVSEQTAAEMTLVENLQRADLSCLEQASAFKNLSQNFLMTQETIAKRVGISREQVSNYMRLLNLPADVFLALQKKELTYSHARLLLMLHSDAHKSKLAQAAVKQKMSVGKLEELVMETVTTDPKEKRPGLARWLDPNVRAVQRSIEESIGMRVRISDRRGKGKITIEYGSLEDFDRLVAKLKS